MEKKPHIQCTAGEVGQYAFLPGAPERVEKIACLLENPHPVAHNREFLTWGGSLDGMPVTVTSTGIGGPSAAIAIEELAALGVHTFIRVGTCGAIQDDLTPGSLILPTAAIRKGGGAQEYMPLAFPAAASFEVLAALRQAAQRRQFPSHTGVVESKDSYYGQHEPERMPVASWLAEQWHAWKAAGALASEMECATLFILGAVLHVRVGAVLLLVRNKEHEKKEHLPAKRVTDTAPAVETAVDAMRALIRADRERQGGC